MIENKNEESIRCCKLTSMKTAHDKPWILVSTSPRRHELLAQAGRAFLAVAPRYVEVSRSDLSPEAEVMLFAREKVWSVRQDFSEGLLIGCDTLVAMGTEKLGKPRDRQDAIAMLMKLAGNTHRVLTGVTLLSLPDERWREYLGVTYVTMKAFSQAQAQAYWETGEPRDKAGAYALQGKAADWVEKIEGDYDNVVGLPVQPLLSLAGELGF